MKRNLAYFASILMLAIGFAFTGCESDPCKDVECGSFGTCLEGDCVCDSGYEGTDCATLSKDKFLGTSGAAASYSVVDACSASGAASYTTGISASSADDTKVLISNFWDAFVNNVEATVDGEDITIANQEPDADGFTVAGSGTIASGVITMNYTITNTGNGDTDVCQSTWTKQ